MSRYRLRLAKDPDGDGPLAAHATEGDGFTVLQEYRGFQFGSAEHRRLSPARKNLLVEADNMGGYTGAASAAEVAAAMTVAQAAFLASAGAQLDYVLDEENAAYADFGSAASVASYRAAHKRTKELNNTIYYDRFRYLLFCEKTWYAPQPYGETGDGWAGANVYCPAVRARSATLLRLTSAATFGQCLGHTATHELGHCVGTLDCVPEEEALRLSYQPLSSGQSVWAEREGLGNTLELDSDAARTNTVSIPLLGSGSRTFDGLASAVCGVSGYSASVLNGCGSGYSFTIPCSTNGQCVVRNPKASDDEDVLWRHLDLSVMESPATVVNAVVLPKFANVGVTVGSEAGRMDFN